MKKLFTIVLTALTLSAFAQVTSLTINSEQNGKQSIVMYKSILTETTCATNDVGEYLIESYYIIDTNPNSPTFREYISVPLEKLFINADLLLVDISKKFKWDKLGYSSLIMRVRENGISFLLPAMALGMIDEEVSYTFSEIDKYLAE